jgi:hypothetical protein
MAIQQRADETRGALGPSYIRLGGCAVTQAQRALKGKTFSLFVGVVTNAVHTSMSF